MFAGVVVAGLWLAASGRPPAAAPTAMAGARAAAAASDPAPVGPRGERPRDAAANHRPFHGIAIQVHNADGGVERYARLLREVAERGADTVLISVNGYQRRVESVLIEIDPARSLSDDELLRLMGIARRAGLRVVLMPKVLLVEPGSTDWRGKIKPTTWEAWFDQYREFIRHYARVAQQGQAALFSVGSELVSTEKFSEQWEEIIRQVREIYRGPIMYSANWDHYEAIQFWDKVDYLGLTSYYKLADEPGPTIETLRESWERTKRDILDFQARVGKPLLFTEIGWCSQEGCSVEAWNYYRSSTATPAGLEEQRRNYQAFIETWANEPKVGGMIWWEWTDDEGGETNFGYTPLNKPAERVLRELWQRKAAEATAGR